MPKCSVILPVYNGAKLLQRGVESILMQTFGDFEFVIVDDGSTDETIRMLEAYAERDDRIKLHRQPKNQGIRNTLQYACSLANGEYIARQDHDDVSTPDRLQKQIAFLDANPALAMSGSDWAVVGPDGRNLGTNVVPTTPAAILNTLLCHDPFADGSLVYRHKFFKDIGYYGLGRPNLIAADDYDCMFRLAERHPLAALPCVTYQYLLNPESIMRRNPKTYDDLGRRRKLEALFSGWYERAAVPAKAYQITSEISDNRAQDRKLINFRHALKTHIRRLLRPAIHARFGRLVETQASKKM